MDQTKGQPEPLRLAAAETRLFCILSSMQILCEGHPRLLGLSSGARFVSHPPRVRDEPVLAGATFIDAYGCSIYGSVLQDGDRFRMWYQAWPEDFDGRDSLAVACVESADGVNWERPAYGLIERNGTRANGLTDLPFHAPSVCIDPDAPAGRRYRAFGYTHPERAVGYHIPTQGKGYYTAHSADGLRWTVEPGPLWPQADVITAAWDPWQGEGGAARIAFKHNGLSAGLHRRRFYTAEWRNGVASEPVSAFIADEVDDQVARSHGCLSADYYGISWAFSPGPTVAIAWMFRHHGPLGHSPGRLWHYGNQGPVDLQLRYQLERGGRWLALPGRPDWLTATDMPEWARGGLYGASHALDVGDETRLYFTGTKERHGWAGAGAVTDEFRRAYLGGGGFANIGLMTWPRGRLLGVRADLPEWIDLQAGGASAIGPPGLRLNVATRPTGRVRVALLDEARKVIEGFGFNDCDGFSGDHLDRPVSWRGSTELPADAPGELIGRVEIESGSLWAFNFNR